MEILVQEERQLNSCVIEIVVREVSLRMFTPHLQDA